MFIDMLTQFSYMWDDHLGRIAIAEHRIKLLPNSNRIHSVPYQAGHIVRELKRLEIVEILFQNVIEPVQKRMVAPVVLTPKKNKSLRFCIDYKKLYDFT